MKLSTPLRSVYLLTFTSALALVGCAAGGVDSEVADVSEASDALAAEGADALEHPRGHGRRHGGPGHLAGLALAELELTDAQRTSIEGLLIRDVPRPEARPAGPPPGAADLAASIRAGRVDAAALARNAPPPPEHAAMHARLGASLAELHAILTPAQRAELAALAEARPANDRKGPPDRASGGPLGRGPDPLAMLLRDLDVDEAQAKRIEAALVAADLAPPGAEDRDARRAEHDARHAALLDAFAKDTFDAEAALPAPEARGKRGPERFLETLAVVVPLLDEAQRETLAARIEAGPPGGMPSTGAKRHAR